MTFVIRGQSDFLFQLHRQGLSANAEALDSETRKADFRRLSNTFWQAGFLPKVPWSMK
jgi:hypothetical protein